ncbi:MAG: hypothetical protein R2932_43685 [Caldilineaceae bacterium]
MIDSGIWPEHPSFADDGSYPNWICWKIRRTILLVTLAMPHNPLDALLYLQ